MTILNRIDHAPSSSHLGCRRTAKAHATATSPPNLHSQEPPVELLNETRGQFVLDSRQSAAYAHVWHVSPKGKVEAVRLGQSSPSRDVVTPLPRSRRPRPSFQIYLWCVIPCSMENNLGFLRPYITLLHYVFQDCRMKCKKCAVISDHADQHFFLATSGIIPPSLTSRIIFNSTTVFTMNSGMHRSYPD